MVLFLEFLCLKFLFHSFLKKAIFNYVFLDYQLIAKARTNFLFEQVNFKINHIIVIYISQNPIK